MFQVFSSDIVREEVACEDIAIDQVVVEPINHEPTTAEECFVLGMACSSGRDGAVDLVGAHQWLNIAASRGHVEAVQARREVASQLTDGEIGAAQRAARDWLQSHPVATAKPVLRIAA